MNIVKMWNESGKVGKILFVFFILTIIGAIVEPPAPPPDIPIVLFPLKIIFVP